MATGAQRSIGLRLTARRQVLPPFLPPFFADALLWRLLREKMLRLYFARSTRLRVARAVETAALPRVKESKLRRWIVLAGVGEGVGRPAGVDMLLRAG
jgi:hypothetical protein